MNKTGNKLKRPNRNNNLNVLPTGTKTLKKKARRQ